MNSLSPTSRLQPQPELRFAGLRFHPMTTDQTVAALAARPADLPFDEWVRLDIRYIETWSLGLDVWILIRTAGVVLRGTGA